MFSFFKSKTDVLNHWIAFVDGFQATPTEFYNALELELAARKIPSMAMSRIEFPEGGLLSERRIYLRMLRERLVFDVCASPFGTGFFFSCRTSEIPVKMGLFEVLIALVVAGILVVLFLVALVFLNFLFLLLLPFIAISIGIGIYCLRNAVALGLQDLDASLTRIPVIGKLYEKFLRRETYHRIDSRLCYLEAVPGIVKKLAEDTTAAKGVKLVRQYEIAPVLGELYRPILPTTAGIDMLFPPPFRDSPPKL